MSSKTLSIDMHVYPSTDLDGIEERNLLVHKPLIVGCRVILTVKALGFFMLCLDLLVELHESLLVLQQLRPRGGFIDSSVHEQSLATLSG